MLIITETILEENIFFDSMTKKVSSFFLKNQNQIIKKFKFIEKKLEDKLKKYDINVNEIKKIAINNAKQSRIKNNKIINFKDQLNFFINSFQKKNLTNVNSNINSQFFKSILTLVCVLYISTFLSKVIIGIVGYKIGVFLSAVLVAPLIEEYSKFVSIKNDFTGMYFVIFNIVEFAGYLIYGLNLGIGLGTMIVVRSFAVLLHLLTTSIQYVFINELKSEKTGFAIAFAIHSFWNTLASMKLLT